MGCRLAIGGRPRGSVPYGQAPVSDLGESKTQGEGKGVGKAYPTPDGRIRHERDSVLRARGGDPVGQHLRAEEAQLNLDGGDLGVLHGLVDSGRGDLAERDAPQQPLVDVLLHGAESVLHRHVGVAAGTLEEVELLAAVELLQHVVDGAAYSFGRPIRALGAHAAFDAEDDLVGVLGVLGEVGLQEGHGVAIRGAIEFSAIPKVHAALQGGAHSLEGLFIQNRVRAPGEAETW